MRVSGSAIHAALRVIDAEDRLQAAILADAHLGVQQQAARDYLSAASDLAIAEAHRWNERRRGR